MDTVEQIRQLMANDLQPQEKVMYGAAALRFG